MTKVKELEQKYGLKPDSYSDRDRLVLSEKGTENQRLSEKWKDHISQRWYGFDLPPGLPESWYKSIDEMLDYCKTIDPFFAIFQIKLKFGGIRMYVHGHWDIDLNTQIRYLETLLYDSSFIY